MAWSDLTFTGCTVLTAAQMNQLQANFAAFGQGAPGAPPFAPNSLMWSGQASGGALAVASLGTFGRLAVSDQASAARLAVSSLGTLQALTVTEVVSADRLSLAGVSSGTPAAGTLYRHPTSGAPGFALPMEPGSATAALAGLLRTAQGAIAAGSPEGWHVVGAASEPAFQNGWTNLGGTDDTVAFRKLPSGLVVLKGMAASGTLNSTVFTLPPGYRPAKSYQGATVANGAFARVQITNDGNVTAISASNAWWSLAGVTLFADT